MAPSSRALTLSRPLPETNLQRLKRPGAHCFGSCLLSIVVQLINRAVCRLDNWCTFDCSRQYVTDPHFTIRVDIFGAFNNPLMATPLYRGLGRSVLHTEAVGCSFVPPVPRCHAPHTNICRNEGRD